MKSNKNIKLQDYIYIRLGDNVKERIKDRARKDGSNMTIWVRQLILKELESAHD